MGVVQKQLVVQFFLPPPQLAAGGIQLLFALLENRGNDSHGGQARQGRCGTCHLEGDCREHGADPTVCWGLPRRARAYLIQSKNDAFKRSLRDGYSGGQSSAVTTDADQAGDSSASKAHTDIHNGLLPSLTSTSGR